MAHRENHQAVMLDEPKLPVANAHPRWVWRSFDYQPRRWHEVLRDALPTQPGRMLSETYLLTRQSMNLVKLRQDRVDVKRLLTAEASGLERWQPVRDAVMPLAPEVVADLCALWQCEAPPACPTVGSPDELYAFLSRHLRDVQVLPARIWRRDYHLHDCMVQRATMLVGGTVLEMLAFEHQDLATLRAALRAVRLTGEENTSCLMALRRQLGWPIGAHATI
jgi:hypothetical protein